MREGRCGCVLDSNLPIIEQDAFSVEWSALAFLRSFLFRIPVSKKLILIDGNHLMHRAYWAIQRSLQTSKGEQTNAVFGVASMLLTILRREHPDAVIACFDEGKETHRHEIHAEYKAGRAETPDDFYVQIPRVRQCMEAFSIPVLSGLKYEADDYLGTLATLAAKDGWEVFIVTGDHDLFQMADHSIKIAVPHQGYAAPEYLDAKGVQAKIGVTPEQVADYKGLVGDSSDNLKGVKGIGPKTAATLLQRYHNLEGVYDHLGEVSKSTAAKLTEGKESAFFCRKMARLVLDAPIPIALQETVRQKAELAKVSSFFAEMEFHTLRSRLRKWSEEDPSFSEFFSGETMLPEGEEETKEERKGAYKEEQLPLFD